MYISRMYIYIYIYTGPTSLLGPTAQGQSSWVVGATGEAPGATGEGSFTSKFTSTFTGITSKFTNILGLDCM